MRAQNSSAQEGSQRKTAWQAGPGPAASLKQVFVLVGGSGNVYSAGCGEAQLLVTSGPDHWEGSPLGFHRQPSGLLPLLRSMPHCTLHQQRVTPTQDAGARSSRALGMAL